jgi:hypothetical protein
MAEPLLLGVRHHGPGSARAVRRALSAFQPDAVLIEGPPEADSLVPLAGDESMRAPVALLAYAADAKDPKSRAAFWPFAEFSPEWQAIRWAVAHDIPVRFIDLPASIRFGIGEPRATRPKAGGVGPVRPKAGSAQPTATHPDSPDAGEAMPESAMPESGGPGAGGPGAGGPGAGGPGAGGPAGGESGPPDGGGAVPGSAAPDVTVPGADEATAAEPDAAEVEQAEAVRTDPIGVLAEAAGYDDPERWWEDVVEHRFGLPDDEDELKAATAPFIAIAEAMIEVRSTAPPPPEAERIDEERREAHMRIALRAALKEFERVAVVCGAWHVPALTAPLPAASADAAVLKGLSKVKVAMTWVPWTHARLASWQGYGAGVTSPGWYHHLFTALDDHVIERWLVRAAGVLRKDGVLVSSAHVIEATRLAHALATLRGRPLPGLAEVTDATQSVLCDGNDVKLRLINRRLVVGDRLGRVPEKTPSVPIARDVQASQRRLRMRPAVDTQQLNLDLRRDIDLGRSRLLHRLRLLGIDWGERLPARQGRGTFWESWELSWQPEFAVDLVEAGAYGTTVREAATARVVEQANAAEVLAEVTSLVERCLLADLPDALPTVLDALDDRMALDADVAHLMDALPALARTLRYGDVRGTDLTALLSVTHGMITRICVGLPAAVGALDDSAAVVMRDRIDAVHGALALLDDAEVSSRWLTVLDGLSTRDDLHGVLAGRLNRLLLDGGRVAVPEIGRRMSLVLTVGTPIARAAAWIEGFLAGDGLLLVHDERLLGLVDTWLTSIPTDAFVEVLPLLRRTFSGYPAPQRRLIGERAANLGNADPNTATGDGELLDDARGALVLATVAQLLGWPDVPTVRTQPGSGRAEPTANAQPASDSRTEDGR